MKFRKHFAVLVIANAAIGLALPTPVLAYGGPGSIVTGIGALLAALAAIAAAVVGFFWFPLKRLVQKLRGEREEEQEVAEASK